MNSNGNHQKYLYQINQENKVSEQAIAEGM